MDKKLAKKIITDLATSKPEDLSISKLQAILNPLNEELNKAFTSNDPLWMMSGQFLHLQHYFFTECLLQKKNTSVAECEADSLINPQELNNFLLAVDRIRQFTLNLYLPKELRHLTRCEVKMVIQVEMQERILRLRYCLEAFRKLFGEKLIGLPNKLDNSMLEFCAGIFGYHMYRESFDELGSDEMYASLSLFPVETVFRCLLVIKGVPNLPLVLAKQVHAELVKQTGLPGGFPVLCKMIHNSEQQTNDDQSPSWRRSEIIARIVCTKGHTKRFYRQVLRDCFALYENSLFSGTEEDAVQASTCVECFRQMLTLPFAYKELHETIHTYFLGRFDHLCNPPDLIAGTILVERSQLIRDLYVNYYAFSGSSHSSLGSALLVPYLSLFLHLLSWLPGDAEERSYLNKMVIFCLANRPKAELEPLISQLIAHEESMVNEMRKIHPRVYLKSKPSKEICYSLQVAPQKHGGEDDLLSEEEQYGDLGPTLVNILKASNHNLLIYDVFVVLLKLFDRVSTESSPSLLLDLEEKDALKCNQFYWQYVIIQALMELVTHKDFYNQLYENPSEILNFIRTLVRKSIDQPQTSNSDVLEVILSLFQEYLHRMREHDDVKDILSLLRQLRSLDSTPAQIDIICNVGNTDTRSSADQMNHVTSGFENARSLCLDREPYCKVYGTTLMIRLLQEKDPDVVRNKYTVLILALDNLKSVEKYAFLNSVRLLVALCSSVLEAETIDALIQEYQSTENELDFRLKVGEATMKTVESLGPVAFKYREQLINCFLHASNSAINEFRASSLANLGNLCKILSYQVHTFFYEMFLRIKSILETDRYPPARRAAVLVLSQLLEGIDSLLTIGEYLLPVYRCLKLIVATEQDETARLQAAVGLDHLKAKTKAFLLLDPDDQGKRFEKEIKIFGIKEQLQADRRGGLLAKGSDNVLIKMLD